MDEKLANAFDFLEENWVCAQDLKPLNQRPLPEPLPVPEFLLPGGPWHDPTKEPWDMPEAPIFHRRRAA